MKKLFLSFLLLASGTFLQAQYRSVNAQVDSFITIRMRQLNIPGLAVAIVKNGVVLKKSVYGLANVEWGNKVTDHTNFQIASCTKLLTSTLLLKAIYTGNINLNASVATYLDSIPQSWLPIKIKNLLSHSSGLPEFYESNTYLPTAAIVRQLRGLPLLFAPGEKEQYGQSDFMLLSHILETIYKKPFVQLLHDEVARPLHMNDGAFDMEFKVDDRYLRTNLITQKATTYYNDKGKLVNYKFLYPQYTYPAGGYFASISDMANWAVGLDKNRLFPLAFADTLIYAADKIDTADAGFSKVGWVIEKEGTLVYGGHSGGPGLGDVWRFPAEKITIITLTNDGELLPGFSRAIAAWYVKGLPPKPTLEKFDR